jgi:hypothetical protein
VFHEGLSPGVYGFSPRRHVVAVRRRIGFLRDCSAAFLIIPPPARQSLASFPGWDIVDYRSAVRKLNRVIRELLAMTSSCL